MGTIVSIGTAVPRFRISQKDVLSFMKKIYSDETASRKLDILFHKSGIRDRHSAVPDFDISSAEGKLFQNRENQPDVSERTGIFRKHAPDLAIEAITDSFAKTGLFSAASITHLITVTCTGIYSPGLDTELIEKVKFNSDLFHLPLNFIGCNGAFPAMKIADMITRTDPEAVVLVVCIELCTLHFQPKDNNDNLLSNTIFSDGSAAAIIIPEKRASELNLSGYQINGFYSILYSDASALMQWNITPKSFEMVLSPELPVFIGNSVTDILMRTGEYFGIDIYQTDRWAIHPGGKKILDQIRLRLNLQDSDLKPSYDVLESYGNMSSSTILFVLHELMKHHLTKGEKILAMGFGPGLTIETSSLQYVH